MPTMWPTLLFTAAMLMGAVAVPEGSARILSHDGAPSFDGTGHLKVLQAGNMDARLPRRLLNGLSICWLRVLPWASRVRLLQRRRLAVTSRGKISVAMCLPGSAV